MSYGSVVTLQGQAKIAAALAGTGTITLAQLAAGDGNGAPVTPLVTQTALVHEVFRGDIVSVARDPAYPTQVIVSATIPSTAGPATIRELGIYSNDGQLVAVASYPATDIAAAGQGAVTTIDVQFVFVVDTAAQVTAQLAPSSFMPLAQMLRAPFIAIDGFATAPPANPALGALVVVGSALPHDANTVAPSGVFANHGDQFAQWTGSVWLTCPAPAETIVGNAADGRRYRRTADGWLLWDQAASTITNVENNYLGAPLSSLPYPDVLTASRTLTLTTATVAGGGGTISTPGGERIKLAVPLATDATLGVRRVFATPAFASGNLAANATYFLRATVTNGALALYLQQGTDTDTIPAGLAGTPNAANGGGFDSTQIDVLLARIVTGAAGSAPVVTALANAADLKAWSVRSSPTLGTALGTGGNGNTRWQVGREKAVVGSDGSMAVTLSWTLNWARTPTTLSYHLYSWVGTALQTQRVSGGANKQTLGTGDRYAQDITVVTDWDEAYVWSGSALQFSGWWGAGSLLALA